MRKKVLIALRMAGIAGQDKLAGIFRYLNDQYGDDLPWDIQLIRTRAELKLETIEAAIEDGVDGFILSIPDFEDVASRIAATQIATVVMDVHTNALGGRNGFTPIRDNLVLINNDGTEIGREAALYLMGQGTYRSYAFLHNPSVMEWSIARGRSFVATLRENDLWGEELREPEEVLKLRRPAAVFAANDDRGYELLEYLRLHKVKVPQEVAVLGINNEALICEHSHPPMSSIKPDFEREGYLSARALDAMLTGKYDPERVQHVGVKEIVRRLSTAELSQAGRLVQKAVAFIDRHALEGIGVEDVVTHLKVSRRLADLRFRQLQGRTILDAITERRLDEVKRLLVSTREPIESITGKCGYSNSNYLKNLFKKRFCMSMRDFRNAGKRK